MKKGKKIIALIVGVLMMAALAITVVACGGLSFGDTDLIKVGIINNPPSESGYRKANVQSFESTFTQANGYKSLNVFEITFDKQKKAFDQFVTAGADYILLSAAATGGWDSSMEKATKAGIPVLLFDRMIDNTGYTAAVVSDMAKEGDMAVEWLLNQKAEMGELNVIHIQGVLDTDAQKGRSAALNKAEDDGELKIVKQQTGNWDTAEAKAIVASVITDGDDFNVIYAENDNMALGAVQALDEAGISHGVKKDAQGKVIKDEDGNVEIDGVIIMGFDCNKWALQDVLDGKWNYNGQCSPFQAEKIDEIIKLLEAGKKPSEKKIINEETFFEAATITADDVEKYGLDTDRPK